MSRLLPIIWLILFATGHYVLVLGSVPAQNQLAATLGASTLSAMVLCVILAARWPYLDIKFGGPDKSYKIHRWLGYSTLLAGLGHWILAKPVGEGIVPSLTTIATSSGKYAMIALIGLSVLAIFRLVPYHIWRHSHLLMGLVLQVSIFHTFFSRIPLSVGGVVWWILLVISAAGLIGWARTILRHFAKSTKLEISAIHPIKNGIDIRLINTPGKDAIRWRPGQFANVSFDKSGMHETHPFTIASAPNSDELRLIVGDFGFYTGQLAKRLRAGDHIEFKEISGCFLPNITVDRKFGQIWLAGGLGITPFLSALEALEPDHGPNISLIYCVRSSTYAIDLYRLMDFAKRLPQFNFYLIKEDQEGYFSSSTFSRLLSPGWQQMQLFVCGPDGLKSAARRAWNENNCVHQIHEEEFDYRNAVGRPIPRRTGQTAEKEAPRVNKTFSSHGYERLRLASIPQADSKSDCANMLRPRAKSAEE